MTKRILVIDDDRFIRDVTQVTLRKIAGWSVSVAAAGLEGLEQAKREKPDAILLDVSMPGMDGFSVLRCLQDDPETLLIPVILLTAKAASQIPSSFSEINLAGVIVKPFDPLTVCQEIAEFVGWQL